MQYGLKKRKRPITVLLDEELLLAAAELEIIVSQAAEQGLARAVAASRSELWVRDNKAALDSSNAYVEKHGLPLAPSRLF